MKWLWILLTFLLNALVLSAALGAPPTHFLRQPQAGTPEVRGNTKVLVCGANGIPEPSYRWMKDGRILSTSRKTSDTAALKITNIQITDAGRYQCQASNVHGALISSSAVIHVAYMRPFANHGNAERYVNLGRAAVIDLPPIDCYPAPSIEWYEGNGLSVSRDAFIYHVTLKNQLVILEARQNLDSKTFKATATNIYTQQTSDSQQFIIKVQNIAGAVGDVTPEIVVPPSNTRVTSDVDDVARLECVINARPLSSLTIFWYHRPPSTAQMKPIKADETKYMTSLYGRVLTILKPDSADAGTYRCEGTFRRQNSPNHTMTADAMLEVYAKPLFVKSPSPEITVEVETLLSLPCEVSGFPRPYTKWYHNGEAITPSVQPHSGYSVVENGSLIIARAVETQAGVYQCFATNDAGEVNSATYLNVTSELPVMSVGPFNRTVVSGDTVTFPCSASGAPRPTVTWSKVSAAMATREQVGGSSISRNDLVLASVELSDGGVYTCTATNSRGTAQINVHLHVAIRTRILTPPQDFSVQRGSAVMLPCDVISDPQFPVSWHWSFNSLSLDMTDVRQRQRMPDGSLHIRSSDGSDIGSYVCQVVSLGGNDSVVARLNVVELPHQPTVTRVGLNSQSETSVDLHWSPPNFNGNSEIRRFVIYSKILITENVELLGSHGVDSADQWQVVGHVAGKDSTEYTIHQLQPSQSYQFCVSAINEVGEGRRSGPSRTLTIPEQAPSGPPRGVFGSPRSESSIILQWQPPEKSRWNGPLLGYQISYKPSGYPDSTLKFENITRVSKNLAEINHLVPFQEYDIAVATYNSKGIGVFSDYTRVRTHEGRPMAPPVEVEAVALNSTALSISWTPPHQRHINGINQGYKVKALAIEGDTSVSESVLIVLSNTSNMAGRQSCTWSDLGKFTKYTITILCFTSRGDGPESRPIMAHTLEDVPDQVGSLTFGNRYDTRLEIFWTPPWKPNGVITGYEIKCQEMNQTERVDVVELPASSNNHTLTGLIAHESYYVSVAAKTQVGVGMERVVAVESGAAPERLSAPQSITLKQIESTTVVLEVGTGAFPLRLEQWIVEGELRHPPSTWKEFPLVSVSGNRLAVAGFIPDMEYRLRVSVENSAGRSNASEPTEWFHTSASIPAVPPERLALRGFNATAVVVMWMPLAELNWNGRGRYYALRYWPCQGKNWGKEEARTERDDSVTMVIGLLEEFTLYCFQVAACNDVGCSNYSADVAAKTMESVPSAGPVSVSVEPLNSTAIHVTWSSVLEIHENGRILGYKVLFRSPVDSSSSVMTVTPESQKSVLLTGLQKFTWYQINVVAFTRIGDGATSFPVATTQTLEDVPGPPTGVFFPAVNESAIQIAWLAPSQPNGVVIGYRVAYGKKSSSATPGSFPVVDESLGKDRKDYVVLGVERSAFYSFSVAARTKLGWGEVTEVEVFTTQNGRVPSRPSRPSVGHSQIGDRWAVMTLMPEVNSHAPVRNYTLQVKVEGRQFMTHAEFTLRNVTEYNITGLSPWTRHWFQLAASNDYGMSEFSEVSEMVRTHPSLPGLPPSDVMAIPQSSTMVQVRWKPPNDDTIWNGDKIGYKIWYRQLNSYNDDEYYARNEEDDYQTATTIYPRTNVVLGNLPAKVMLEVKVALINNVGHGPMSSSVDVILDEAAPSVTPEDVRASAVGPTSIQVMWRRISEATDDYSNCLGYKVLFWVVGSKGNMTQGKLLSLADSQTIVSGLRTFTLYAFQVAVFGAGGDGLYSSTAVRARTEDGLPGPPAKLMVFVTSQTSVNVTWELPADPNGVIEGYELTYFQEMLVDGESKNVHVAFSGDKTTYHAQDLMSEARYTFRLRAKTRHGWGGESSKSVAIGSQPGSPESPGPPECSESDSGIEVTWEEPGAGSSPLTSYILQYRQLDQPASSNWMTMTITTQSQDGASPVSMATISSQHLVPGALYQVRVFAVNSQGTSLPSPVTEHVFERDGFHAQSVTAPPFYQSWWFLLAVAVGGLIVILSIVVSLCVTVRRRRAKIVSKDSLKKKQNGQAKVLQSPIMSIDDETGFATIERRYPQPWGGQRYPKASTLPLYLKAPPRPSPGSILYDTELISQHEDSGNVSDKASQNEDSDGEADNHMAAFLNHPSKRPQSLYGANLPDNPAYTISLSGGHSVTPKYHTMRPQKLSSFV